jgi:membrane associated rhomboid family serine protease
MSNYSPQGFTTLPPVIKNLLIINGLFFLASISFQQVFSIDLTRILGLHYPSADRFSLYQFVSYMFMHGSFGHLFFNMFALWMFGNVLENLWGPKRFLIYYFVTGIGAALTHYAIFYFEVAPALAEVSRFLENPSIESFLAFRNSDNFTIASREMSYNFNHFVNQFNALANTNPSAALDRSIEYAYAYRTDLLNAPVVVGASGAVFGLLLAFGMLFPNTLIYLYFAIPIKAKYFVIGYGVLELASGIMDRPGDNVAHFAHLGGMVFGFIMLHYWEQNSGRKHF